MDVASIFNRLCQKYVEHWVAHIGRDRELSPIAASLFKEFI